MLLITLHDESLTRHGGSSGICDDSLINSALNRAPNLAHYGEPYLASLAAAYGMGLAKNHAFIDGNERAAFLKCGFDLGSECIQASCLAS